MPVDVDSAVVRARERVGDLLVEDAGPCEELGCSILRADGECAVR